MSETEPTLDTSSSEATDDSMEIIATAITTGMGIVGGVLGDPCSNKTDLFNRWQLASRLNALLVNGSKRWAQISQDAVRDAVANWGRGARDTAGAKPFGTYLINQYTVWNPARVRPNLRNGRGMVRPSARNAGDKIGPGVYVNTSSHTLQGSRVQQAYDSWFRWMTQHVYSSWSGRPQWRARLQTWVGRSRDDWRIWVYGDPIAPDSRIGMNLALIENLRLEHEAVAADCERRLETARQMGLAQSETEQGMIAAGLEQGLAEETTERTQVITLALAAFGVTWLLSRGRR